MGIGRGGRVPRHGVVGGSWRKKGGIEAFEPGVGLRLNVDLLTVAVSVCVSARCRQLADPRARPLTVAVISHSPAMGPWAPARGRRARISHLPSFRCRSGDDGSVWQLRPTPRPRATSRQDARQVSHYLPAGWPCIHLLLPDVHIPITSLLPILSLSLSQYRVYYVYLGGENRLQPQCQPIPAYWHVNDIGPIAAHSR